MFDVERWPLRFAGLVVAYYFLAALLPLVAHRFDLSIFLVAGDRFVDAGQTPTPILVHPHSAGYDGQFFYRLALDPWHFDATAFGVQLDKPAFRMSRIFYPVLAWMASLGLPGFVPAALFGLNLLGLGAIALIAAALARDVRLPGLVPVAIVMWPGFLVSLMHDTAEIIACALMLAAILCRVRRQFTLYAVVAALATLTRETTVPVFAGLLLWDVAAARNGGRRRPIAAGLALFVPFVAWRFTLDMVWHVAPDSQAIRQNMGALPFAGWLQTVLDALDGARHWAAGPLKNGFVRLLVFVTAAGLAVFCLCAAWSTRALLRGANILRPLAVSWPLLLVMMAFLKASGPWVEPAGYLRAFTECYAVGCLVLGASNIATPQRAWVAWGFVSCVVLVWIYCITQIGLHQL